MNMVSAVFDAVYGLLKHPFNLMGFNISFLEVAIWSTVASLILWFFSEVFD